MLSAIQHDMITASWTEFDRSGCSQLAQKVVQYSSFVFFGEILFSLFGQKIFYVRTSYLIEILSSELSVFIFRTSEVTL